MIELADAKACARHLSGLADPTRVRLFDLLLGGPRSVTDLADVLDIEFVNAMYHLLCLRTAGLVRKERAGREAFYSPAELVADGRDGKVLNLGWCRLIFPRR